MGAGSACETAPSPKDGEDLEAEGWGGGRKCGPFFKKSGSCGQWLERVLAVCGRYHMANKHTSMPPKKRSKGKPSASAMRTRQSFMHSEQWNKSYLQPSKQYKAKLIRFRPLQRLCQTRPPRRHPLATCMSSAGKEHKEKLQKDILNVSVCGSTRTAPKCLHHRQSAEILHLSKIDFSNSPKPVIS